MKSIIKTKRLILRPWQQKDVEPFAQLNSDARVMEFFPSMLNRQESDTLAKRISDKLEEQGWGFMKNHVDQLVPLYLERLNLHDAVFSHIDHEDAMVAIVYKIMRPNGE